MNEDLDIQISDVREIRDYTCRWPDGEELYPKGWEYEVDVGERPYKLRHLVGTRKVGGSTRPRTTTMIGNSPVVEGMGADDYETSHSLVSLVRRKYGDRRNVRKRDNVPPVYDDFEVVWYRKEVNVKGARNAFAVKIREDDLERWARHALIRWGVLGADVTPQEDLRDPAVLRDLFEGKFRDALDSDWTEWPRDYEKILRIVLDSSPAGFADPETQARLWDQSPISGLGQGEFPLLKDQPGFEEFARIAAAVREEELPEDDVARRDAYRQIYRRLSDAIQKTLGRKRVPHGKIFRYLAALFPRDFSSIASRGKLGQTAKAILGEVVPKHPVFRHGAIMDALERALGPAGGSVREQVRRAIYPWWLYSQYVDVDIDDGEDGGEDEVPEEWTPPSFEEVWEGFQGLRYVFPRELVAKLHAALHAHARKHFVLLSGLSGTGKTQLARIYSRLYSGGEVDEESDQVCLVPVQPDWTDPSGLLGYVNPLRETVTYERTECLRFLHRAQKNADLPYFLILDEMNLARPEYYFAPFLSAMETGEPLVVHSQGGPIDVVEPMIPWPQNLYIIGTVNMDETTHAFSDKVLDRAFTIELWDVDLGKLREKLEGYPEDLLDHAFRILGEVHGILEPVRMHVGYRTLREVVLYLRENERGEAPLVSRAQATDAALYMKVLPRLRGEDSKSLRGAMDGLIGLAERESLEACRAKLERMKEELTATGITKFWR